MNDDDIPVLTNVVKRERRIDPPLNAATRDALIDAIQARTEAAAANIVDDLMTDMHIVMKDLLRDQLHEQLVDLVAETIDTYLAEHAALKAPETNT